MRETESVFVTDGSVNMSEDSDLHLVSPFVDYMNQILMEEDEDDDSACMKPVDILSYQSTFSSFYEILAGKHSQIISGVHSTCGNEAADARLPPLASAHQEIANPSNGFVNTPCKPRSLGASGIFSPTNGNCSHQERAEGGSTLKHAMVSHTPFTATPFPELHEMRNGMSDFSSCVNFDGLNEASASVRCGYDSVALNNHSAISLNDGVLTPAMVSGLSKDTEGLSDHRCMRGQEQGNDFFKLPLTDEELSLKLAEVEVSFEDMQLNNVYSDLYTGEHRFSASSNQASRERKHNGDKKMVLGGKGRKTGKVGVLELDVFVDVMDVLVSCAQAVAIGDAETANALLRRLCQVHGASANGTSLQRIAHLFSKALAARMRGLGEQQYQAMSCKMPSTVTLLHATKVAFELIPHLKVIHYYANQSILKAAEGASRLHIVDFGLTYGIQWPCLISALADRKGGPPLLVITGIEHPQPGVNPAKRLEKSGQRLASYAKHYDVPFQYHFIVSNKWEDLDAASLNLQKGEVLVVNCIKCLCHLADESVDLALPTCPRQKFLTFMRSLNPLLLLIAVRNAAYTAPFFVSRFREALHHFSNSFDLLETLWGDDPLRQLLERSAYREILNIVGCEGAERVERQETYKQWHVRITNAGFEQLPLLPTIVSRSRSHVEQHYHKDFLFHDDGKGWMLMGWKGQTAFGISAWKPRLV